MQIPVSHRYALTIFDLCKDNGWLDKVYNDFKSLHNFFEISEDFSDFIKNPVFNHVQRANIIQKLLKNNIDDVTLRILLFIEEKSHLYMLDEIVGRFLELYREHQNIIKIKIISSSYLSQEQINKIRGQFSRKFNKIIESDLVIDTRLIGGLKIMVGDTVYDFSFINQLNRFKERILTTL
jgi:F-type H+-transporting ATPase subunit delta